MAAEKTKHRGGDDCLRLIGHHVWTGVWSNDDLTERKSR